MATDNTAPCGPIRRAHGRSSSAFPPAAGATRRSPGAAVFLSSAAPTTSTATARRRRRVDGAMKSILSRIRAATIQRRNRMKRILAAGCVITLAALASTLVIAQYETSAGLLHHQRQSRQGRRSRRPRGRRSSHCQSLAAKVGAGSRTWRAYLSTQGKTTSDTSVTSMPATGSEPVPGTTRRACGSLDDVADLHSPAANQSTKRPRLTRRVLRGEQQRRQAEQA